jgi:hypothetical protein
LTSSSPLRDKNSFRKTAMSRREDILSSIDVKIMDRSANTARPSSYSKTLPASTPLFAGHADIEIPSPGEVDLASAIANRSHLQWSPAQGPSRTAALAPGEADFSMLPATPGVFLSNLLHGLHGKMQGTIAARYTLEKRSEIESGEKPPVALKHFGRQFVAVVVDGVDSAGQPREPSGVLVLHPHAKNPYRGRSRAVHLYSISRDHPVKYWIMRKIEEHAMHAASSLTGIKTSVSRGVV